MQQLADFAPGSGLEQLDAPLADVMRDTGASVGLLYLLPPGERVLQLTVISGVSQQIAAPWARITVGAPLPVADAVRQQRLVWLSSQEEVARRYPQLALVLPYEFMLAAAPVTCGTSVWGGLVLLWPIWHPPQLSSRERDAISTCCESEGGLLQQAADQGQPLLPTTQPRVLAPLRSGRMVSGEAPAAFDFAERLPQGCCALDLDGRVTFINTAASDLLGTGVGALLGSRPWESLPWLRNPLFEDRYRAAVVSRWPASFTILRPPDQWLFFQLHPDDSGISIQITQVPAEHAKPTMPWQHTPPAPEVGATALYHLTHLAASLTQAVGADDVVQLACDQIVPAFGPQALALMTAEEGRLRVTGTCGFSAELTEIFDSQRLASDTPAVRALLTGDPGFYATFADLKRAYPPAVHKDELPACAVLPLIASGRTVGALILSYDRPRPFPAPERAILASLAGLIAQALDRARLYDIKHQLAHTLQTGLLPHALPTIQGLNAAARYQPAGHGIDIGGDFYDLIPYGEASAAAAIGDVQGHNITAAALMGQVRIAVHAHATAGTPPGEALARTNRLLIDLDPGLFTSCLYANLDLAHHRARLATAGHPPPLMRHPDGHTEILHLPPGLLLGIDPDATYPTTEIPLPPGALLALYTDGLIETPGTDIDHATADLVTYLAQVPDQTIDALADTLINYRPPTSHQDDIALLLIQARDCPIDGGSDDQRDA
ncbi:SpoIIE family protein phosphatase [Streptomyces sp. NPDC047082]|uniref:SpoIIE family protein phosphatase n=1 Tax=Streptomyces sp. NPDC047082 TaxID=3155259 RepID=UPI0033E62D00